MDITERQQGSVRVGGLPHDREGRRKPPRCASQSLREAHPPLGHHLWTDQRRTVETDQKGEAC